MFAGRRVLVTGHTGFKGSWLCTWLHNLGAEISGFALPPATDPSLFTQLGLSGKINSLTGDIRSTPEVDEVVARTDPEIVFHMAAQSLVRVSYREPVNTWQTNVQGTVHLLEALRRRNRPCVVVVITSDKCYAQDSQNHTFREEDPLGGHDPYSASKAATELVAHSYRQAFFANTGITLATARAGNVIGGGDWALDRLIPDCMRALSRETPITIRNPRAVRPWQHVLEPLSAYLCLAAALHGTNGSNPLCDGYNIGPGPSGNRTVADVVEEVAKHWPGNWEAAEDADAPHEAPLLQLDITKARNVLGWIPRWDFATSVQRTVHWYRQVLPSPTQSTANRELQQTEEDIAAYVTS